jgi:hypothetical protein
MGFYQSKESSTITRILKTISCLFCGRTNSAITETDNGLGTCVFCGHKLVARETKNEKYTEKSVEKKGSMVGDEKVEQEAM